MACPLFEWLLGRPSKLEMGKFSCTSGHSFDDYPRTRHHAAANKRPRVTKLQIGEPRDFQHLNSGAHLSLETSSVPVTSPTFYSQLKPVLGTHTPTGAPQQAGAPARPQRKDAPGITPSVIRSVPRDSPDAMHLPPPVGTTAAARVDGRSVAPRAAGVDGRSLPPSGAGAQASLTPSMRQYVQAGDAGFGVDENGDPLDSKGRPMVRVAGDYATTTEKVRHDGYMREVADALKRDNI